MTNLSELLRKIEVLKPLTKILEDVSRSVQVQRESLRINLLSDPKHDDPKRLNRYELRYFSQNGEDGIIAEILHRIGTRSRVFAEIGAGDGLENNTAFLLLQGWTGFWFDAGQTFKQLEKNAARHIAANRLVAREEFLTAENVADVMTRAGVPHDIDVLSVDIDRNTSYVWKALAAWRPRMVIVEYNASFPPTISWQVQYQPARAWNGSLYYGASLLYLEELGREMGYTLVGCDFSGVNAFFVRDDLVGDRFCAPYTAVNHFEPARHYLCTKRAFVQGFEDCEFEASDPSNELAVQNSNGKVA